MYNMSSIALKRIARDVNMVVGNETLAKQGIYYFADESNMSRGTALLVGQSDTPYFGGFYFFSIQFPDDYPFSPIKIKSLTQDGATRFNPNMYKEGKVCLSILNTWHDGPQWTGVQSLESVLLVIMSDVLNAIPLQNEPAFRTCGLSPESVAYNTLVWHANVETAVLTMLLDTPAFAVEALDTMKAQYAKNRQAILERVLAAATDYDGKTGSCRVFTMTRIYTFARLAEKLNVLKS